MSKSNKPPIGTVPYYLVAQSRISSLANAIDRYAMKTVGETRLIKKWANEIIAQCDLIEKLDQDRRKLTKTHRS